uniref:Uncharacterized protein n=1 Tax=Panagrolaimus davidi TaxID=227884 RepID=A0A914QVW3_9BILA
MSKLWITEGLRITDNGGNGNIKNLITKLYQCDAINLSLMGINIGFMDLKHLSKSVNNFDMNYSSVIDKNRDLIPFEDILQETECSSSITYKRKIDQNVSFWKTNIENYTDDLNTSDEDSSSEDSEMNDDIYGEDSEISKETTSDDSEMSTDSDESY